MELNFFSRAPFKALSEQAGPCLRDVGVNFSVLDTTSSITNRPRKYDSMDIKYPGLRQKLENQLYKETNQAFRNLLRKHWNINNFDF